MSRSLKATLLICTLSPSPKPSSSEFIADELVEAFTNLGVTSKTFRIADYNVSFGVEKDMGDGDEWPTIRTSILDSEILVIATPIWMGQPSAICKMVLERLDAELAESDEEGRPLMYGKVGTAAIVGNEDGAHHCSAEIFQALSDVGFTIPAGGPTYWVGEAMGSTDYKDLEHKPSKTVETTKMLARNSAHLAKLLQRDNYPSGQ